MVNTLLPEPEIAIGTIKNKKIEEEMRTSYLDYAMSVIVARALPDIRDGLKPVQRRILYAIDDLSISATSSHKKSARIVGEVLGKYHPHSEAPVYEAMVRMAQPFTMRYPLVDGQGNFGSIDADPPAAMRYTEARLSRLAEELLADLDKQTVDFTPNFDGSLTEPTVLPARLPNILVNGSSGIAVGMATNIPPHHLGEIAEAIKLLIQKPDVSVDELVQIVKGPDFPTGARVFGRAALREIYATGRGRFVMQAEYKEEEARGNRAQIVFVSLPYQTNKAALIERIADLVRERRIEGIADLRDESDREGLRVVVELKRAGQIRTVRNQLFKLTSLSATYAVNMLALVNGQPRTVTLRQTLQAFIDHRREIIRRRTQFDLDKARARHHIVEGLLKAIRDLTAVIKTIREARSADAAKATLQQRPYSLSERQAQAVLDMQLRRLAALERQKLQDEHEALTARIAELEGILHDPKEIDALICADMDDLAGKYAGPRKTTIIEQDVEDVSDEDLIAHEATVISVSSSGYIKRMPLASYRPQHRGGKGVSAMKTRDRDAVRHLLVTDTHDNLLLFTDRGCVFSLKAHEIPERSREWRGLPLANLIQLNTAERVTAIVPAASFEKDFLVLATRAGEVKKTQLSAFASVRRAGLIAFNLKPGDELVRATYAHAGDDVIVVSDAGRAIRFPVDSLRAASRGSGGVRAIRVPEDRQLVGLDTVKLGSQILTLTAKGYGKRTSEAEYPRKGRGGLGIVAHKTTTKTGPVVALRCVTGDEELVIISRGGKFLRTGIASIGSLGRSTMGVRTMDVRGSGDVAAVAVVSLASR